MEDIVLCGSFFIYVVLTAILLGWVIRFSSFLVAESNSISFDPAMSRFLEVAAFNTVFWYMVGLSTQGIAVLDTGQFVLWHVFLPAMTLLGGSAVSYTAAGLFYVFVIWLPNRIFDSIR